MKKKIIALLLITLCALNMTACSLDTISSISEDKTSFADVNDLQSGKAYIWSDDKNSLEKDVNFPAKKDVFFTCPTGTSNCEFKNINIVDNHTVWVDSENEDIPTLTSSDKLIYIILNGDIPESFTFERMADYGYSVGISGLTADKGNHYYISLNVTNKDGYKEFFNEESDAVDVGTALSGVEKIYLDKIGDTEINSKTVSKGGTVLGLKKNKSYVCNFYQGTSYQDFQLSSKYHTFSMMERFDIYDFDFLHSNCISLTIPDYFKTGYYYVNGVGLFRYVSDEDLKNYNGKDYDKNINWNDPIILYDENGMTTYDPSQDTDEGDDGLSDEDLPAANSLEQSQVNWVYEATDKDFVATVEVSQAIRNADASVLTVTRPDGTSEEIEEFNSSFTFKETEPQSGTYNFLITNMANRTYEVKYE